MLSHDCTRLPRVSRGRAIPYSFLFIPRTGRQTQANLEKLPVLQTMLTHLYTQITGSVVQHRGRG